MKTGILSSSISSVVGGNAALIALIAAGALLSTPPSGSLGQLTAAALRAAEESESVIGVVDFGRNDLTVVRHSAGNLAAIKALIDAVAGTTKYTLAPGVTNKTSAAFDFKNAAGASLVQTVADAGVAPAGAFEIALAEALAPSPSAMSAAGVINQVENALTKAEVEGFMVIETDGKTFTLYVIADTSVEATFQTEAATVAAVEAAAFIAKLHMEPSAASTSTTSII